jgi:DNA sulfur modification protein DndE
MSNKYRDIARVDRRALLAGSALTLVAGQAEAQQTPLDAGSPPAARTAAGKAPDLSRTWAASLALQAATYAAPIVAMYNLRASVAFGPKSKAAPGQIWLFDQIATPKIAAETGYVSPNVNTLYGFGFTDLGPEPYILTTPDSDGRYYMIELVDMWTNAFAYPAGVVAGYKGGKFALVGPGWKGTLPDGVTRIDCPTRWIELQPRVHVKNEADLPGAQKALHAIKLQGLAEYSGGASPPRPAYNYQVPNVNPKVASSQMQFVDPMQFWSIFAAAMNENPPPDCEIKAVLPQFKYLGIELGKPWSSEGVRPMYLEEMKKAVEAYGATMNQSKFLVGERVNGWVIFPWDAGVWGSNYMARGVASVVGLTWNAARETIYYGGAVDGQNQAMTGAKRYTITFAEPMLYAKPVPPGFWSLTIYDSATDLTVPNPINRYSLGSDNDLKKNADGSITMYLQHDNPGPDKEANWLPAPAGAFYLWLRNYPPGPALVEALKNLATFQGPPPVVPVG